MVAAKPKVKGVLGPERGHNCGANRRVLSCDLVGEESHRGTDWFLRSVSAGLLFCLLPHPDLLAGQVMNCFVGLVPWSASTRACMGLANAERHAATPASSLHLACRGFGAQLAAVQERASRTGHQP